MNTWIRLTAACLLAAGCSDERFVSDLAQLDAGVRAGERPYVFSPFGNRRRGPRRVSDRGWTVASGEPGSLPDEAIDREVRQMEASHYGVSWPDGEVPEPDASYVAVDAAIDASAPIDATVPTDAGDAALDDANVNDAGVEDAGPIDSGPIDSGPIDSGTDAGEDAGVVIPDPDDCEPWSATVTPTGVLRCVQEPPPDLGPFNYRVALTFDDGPNPATTPSVLQTLREQNVPATFFMVGLRLDNVQAQAIARDIHADPLFTIGNHTRTHAHMAALDAAAVQMEIESTSASIRNALLDPCFFPRYFRFPYSEASCAAVQAVREHGHAVAGLHIDSSDWCYASGNGYCAPASVPWMEEAYRNDIVGHVLSQVDRYQGGIILMHDIHANTAAQLPSVIAALRDAGVTFVRLDDLAAFPALNAEISVPEPPLCCDGHVR